MKFQKTLVAVAIAGIAAVPMVASADTTLSGVVEINMNGNDLDDIKAVPDDPATLDVDETVAASSPGDLKVGTGDVLFGIVSEHELSSGLTGYGSLRLDLDSLSNTDSPSEDNVYVGIKGGFGDVRLGEIPLAVEYGQVANDIYDVGGEINGGLSYTGSFGPVGLIANFSPEPNSDAVGIGAKFGLGGFSIGLGAEDRAERQNIAAGASFAFAGASVAAHFWTQEQAAGTDDLESMSVKVGYGFGGVTAALTFSTLNEGNADEEAVRLDLGYGLGGGTTLSSRITSFSGDNIKNAEQVQYRVQLAKSF